MKKIKKYKIERKTYQEISVSYDCVILHVAVIDNTMYLYTVENESQPTCILEIGVLAVGDEIPWSDYEVVGAITKCPYEWLVFEILGAV